MSSSKQPGAPAAPDTTPGGGKGRRVALTAVALVVACALIWFVWWFIHRDEISTDDAYIHADIAQIAPRITGTVSQVFVSDNEHVSQGDVLFTLDPSIYKAALSKAQANLKAAQASFNASQKDLALTRKTSAADIVSAKAALSAARAESQRAQADAARYRALYAKHEVSHQQFDLKKTQAKSAREQVNQARAGLAQAKAAPDLIQLKQAKVETARARIAQAKSAVRTARLNMSYTKIRAPHSGQIAKKSIVTGSQINVGQAAMALVEDDPWVVANYKETQLDRIRPGQPVSIKIDAYPDHQFDGRVDSIQPGSGVTFSLLPPQNATGNFVKIVQRVPVKIVFTKPQQLQGLAIAPGLSVEPTIHVGGQQATTHHVADSGSAGTPATQ